MEHTPCVSDCSGDKPTVFSPSFAKKKCVRSWLTNNYEASNSQRCGQSHSVASTGYWFHWLHIGMDGLIVLVGAFFLDDEIKQAHRVECVGVPSTHRWARLCFALALHCLALNHKRAPVSSRLLSSTRRLICMISNRKQNTDLQTTMEEDNTWENMPPPKWSDVKILQDKIARLENDVDRLAEEANPTRFWLEKTMGNNDVPDDVKTACRRCSVSPNRSARRFPDVAIYEDRNYPEAIALVNVMNNPFIPRMVKIEAKKILDTKHGDYVWPQVGADDNESDDDDRTNNFRFDDDEGNTTDDDGNALARNLEMWRRRGNTVNYIEEYYANGPIGYLSNGWPYGEGNNGEKIPLNYKLARAALMNEPGSLLRYGKWKAHAMRRVVTLEVRE